MGYTFPITTMSCTRMAKKKMIAKKRISKVFNLVKKSTSSLRFVQFIWTTYNNSDPCTDRVRIPPLNMSMSFGFIWAQLSSHQPPTKGVSIKSSLSIAAPPLHVVLHHKKTMKPPAPWVSWIIFSILYCTLSKSYDDFFLHRHPLRKMKQQQIHDQDDTSLWNNSHELTFKKPRLFPATKLP